MESCGARNRSGGRCKKQAGWGTDHVGEGRCRLHGGATPIKHGRYSKVSRPRIRELLVELDKDPDPLNLVPEAQLIRALAMDFAERYEDLVEALLAWNLAEQRQAEEEERTPRPQRLPSLHELTGVVEAASRVVERILRHRKETAITLETFNRVMRQMGVVVARHVTDAKALASIEREWLSIQAG